jgi:lipoate-protein ligase A
MTRLRLLRLDRTPIFRQLCLEEALFRSSRDLWCVVNRGAPGPNVVMGMAGQPESLLHVDRVIQCAPRARPRRRAGVPVIRRYTGGGTVVTD